MHRCWFGIALFAVVQLGAGANASAQAAARRAVLVTDFSAGMASSLGGPIKSVVLRSLLPDALARVEPDVQLGAVVFGNRPRNGCANVTEIQSLAPLDATGLAKAMTALRAHKSRSPLSDALSLALDSVSDDQGGDIIAVIGGSDTCRKDPCAVAQSIADAGRPIRITLIGVGLTAADTELLRCLPERTGGTLVLAQDQAELGAALQLALAHIGKAPEAPPPVTTGPPELQLSLRFATQTQNLAAPATWRVERLAGDGTVSLVAERSAAELRLPVAAGRYRVSARLDLAEASADVTVAAEGPTRAVLELNAGVLAVLIPEPVPGTVALTGVTAATLNLTKTSGGTSEPETLVLEAARSRSFILPVGSYTIGLEQQGTRVDKAVTIASGQQLTETLDLAHGVLGLDVRAGADQGHAEAARIAVFVDAPAGAREVARSAAAQPSFALPAGTYRVVAQLGPVLAESQVVVRSGEVTQQVITLASGELAVSVAVPEVAGELSARAWLEIWALAPPVPERIIRTTRTMLVEPLAAGDYRVDFGIGQGPSRASRTVSVAAGGRVKVDLAPELGVVNLRMALRALGQVRDVRWELRDNSGAPLFATVQFQPSLALAPGSYQVIAHRRGDAFTASFVVAAGERATVEVAPE